MLDRIKRELTSFGRALAELDRQTLTVLVLSTIFVIAQYKYGTRRFFRAELAAWMGYDPRGLAPFVYHCLTQALSGFLLPALILLLIFRRKASEIGLGLGDWKLALVLAALYLPIVVVACWFLSAEPDFLRRHPQLWNVTHDWNIFLVYQACYLLNWIGWEYLWRGFVLFGTAPTFGRWAIVIQMIPFAVLHYHKPGPEAFLSVFGGLLLGALVWRCRSFWIAVPIHWFQMLSMDLFCALRKRTDVTGTDLGALGEAIQGFWS